MENMPMTNEATSLLNATNAIEQFVTNAITSDNTSITEVEIATTNSGKEKINSFKDEDKRLSAQKLENEHEEAQTKTREKFKTLRTAIIASSVISTVALLLIVPLSINSMHSA